MVLFSNFAGHAPQIEPLLERRGLIEAPQADDTAPAGDKGETPKPKEGGAK
jgi:hypothetical protein